MKKILMTGAAGGVGTFLRPELRDRYDLVLSDLRDIDDLHSNERFVAADLADPDAVFSAAEGVDGIIHLGGYAVEGPWPTIRDANIEGTYNIYEAARQHSVKRVVFASSNHTVGFYPRTETIDHLSVPRPDTRYGVSKVCGEAVASLYADKYGVESMCVRIGNVAVKPVDARRLAIWISPRDLARLIGIGLDHPEIRHEIVYGVSQNQLGWWDNRNATRLGYRPRDSSEPYAEDVLAHAPPEDPDSIATRCQGGNFAISESGGDPSKPDQPQ